MGVFLGKEVNMIAKMRGVKRFYIEFLNTYFRRVRGGTVLTSGLLLP